MENTTEVKAMVYEIGRITELLAPTVNLPESDGEFPPNRREWLRGCYKLGESLAEGNQTAIENDAERCLEAMRMPKGSILMVQAIAHLLAGYIDNSSLSLELLSTSRDESERRREASKRGTWKR